MRKMYNLIFIIEDTNGDETVYQETISKTLAKKYVQETIKKAKIKKSQKLLCYVTIADEEKDLVLFCNEAGEIVFDKKKLK